MSATPVLTSLLDGIELDARIVLPLITSTVHDTFMVQHLAYSYSTNTYPIDAREKMS